MDSDLKRQEEAKRERCWDARERWAALMAAIRFADAQQPVSRNSKQRCLELQAEHWAQAQREQSSADE